MYDFSESYIVYPSLNTPRPFCDGIGEEFQEVESGMARNSPRQAMNDAPFHKDIKRGSAGLLLTGYCEKLPSTGAATNEDARIQPAYSASVYATYIFLSYYVVYYEPRNRPF